jgi:hypothetical protein
MRSALFSFEQLTRKPLPTLLNGDARQDLLLKTGKGLDGKRAAHSAHALESDHEDLGSFYYDFRLSRTETVQMRVMFPIVLLALAGCSHAEESATTPAPRANFVVASNIEAEALEQATRFCRYYHSEPAVLVDRAGTISRFECAGRARGTEPSFLERLARI